MKKIMPIVFIVLWLIPAALCAQDDNEQRLVLGSLDWSPDGSSLIFAAMFVKPDFSNYNPEFWKLYRYQLETQRLEVLEHAVLFASYGPDGNRIAYGKYVGENWEIFMKDLSSGKTTRLTENDAKDNAPSWSPDGKRLVFNSDRDGNYEVFVMNSDGSGIVQVTKTDTIKNYNPEWSPNDDLIVYYQEKGDDMDQIYLTDSKGSFFRNLTKDQNHNFYPSWTSENQIVYTRSEAGFFTIGVGGSAKSKLDGANGFYTKQAPGRSLFAILNPDEQALFFFNSKTQELVKVIGKKDLISSD